MLDITGIAFPSLHGEEERRAYIFVPDRVLNDPELRLPVLYMFDGHNVFLNEDATYGKSWGMLEYLNAANTPLIVAALECSHAEKDGRLSEYSPFSFKDRRLGVVTGAGEATMDWFCRVFKPFVDENYPTIPDRSHTFIAGSSMGGLMSLFAITAYNDVFSRAAALSPTLDLCPSQLDDVLKTAPLSPDTVLYMDYGEQELLRYRRAQKRFRTVTEILLNRKILLNLRVVPGGEHCEASWERQIPFFILCLLYDPEVNDGNKI